MNSAVDGSTTPARGFVTLAAELLHEIGVENVKFDEADMALLSMDGGITVYLQAFETLPILKCTFPVGKIPSAMRNSAVRAILDLNLSCVLSSPGGTLSWVAKTDSVVWSSVLSLGTFSGTNDDRALASRALAQSLGRAISVAQRWTGKVSDAFALLTGTAAADAGVEGRA